VAATLPHSKEKGAAWRIGSPISKEVADALYRNSEKLRLSLFKGQNKFYPNSNFPIKRDPLKLIRLNLSHKSDWQLCDTIRSSYRWRRYCWYMLWRSSIFLFSIRIDLLTACIELFSACKLASACISKESEDKHFSSPALLSSIGGGAINSKKML
jgi:hypothetical protein